MSFFEPGGSLVLASCSDDDSPLALPQRLLLSGFVDTVERPDGTVITRKPKWEVGASSAIEPMKTDQTSAAPGTVVSPLSCWLAGS